LRAHDMQLGQAEEGNMEHPDAYLKKIFEHF
jgi:hypothetical protein